MNAWGAFSIDQVQDIVDTRIEFDDYAIIEVDGIGRTCMRSNACKSLRQREVPKSSRLLWAG